MKCYNITISTVASAPVVESVGRMWRCFDGGPSTCRKTSAAAEAPWPQAVMVGEGLSSTDFASSGPQAIDGRAGPTMTLGSGCVLGNNSVISQQALKAAPRRSLLF